MDYKERLESEKETRQFLLKFTLARETLDGGITEEMVDEEIRKRLQDSVYDEYLVDGAVLTCTSAKWGNFNLSDGGSVKIDGRSAKLMTGKPIEVLRVLENPIFSNDIRHATVADTQQGWNIMPFPCNCMEPATPEQEEMIKVNMIDCQSHGVCKYLMELEEEWENIDFEVPYAEFPNAKMKSLLENKQATEISDGLLTEPKKGITMTSVLFCKHGGFIYPLTSGQTVLHDELLKFISEYGLTGRQCMALYEIMGYLESNPKLCIGTTIFVFEGLATPRTDDEAEWNGMNKYHPNGQFGAIAIVTVDGRLEYALLKASTLPDSMKKSATICEGIYEVKSGPHGIKPKENFEGYAALWLNNNGNIPAYNSKFKNDYADLIHFHMAGVMNSNNPDPQNPYSEGCITIPLKDYLEFGLETEFLNEEAEKLKDKWDNYKATDYSIAKWDLLFSKYANQNFKGYMVIDRQYYDDVKSADDIDDTDDTKGYLKFNGPRGGGRVMFRRSVWAMILILRIMGAAISGEDDMKEEVKEDVRDYMLTKDYCSIDEFEDMDYYLFCDSWLSTGSGDGFKTKQSIISIETQTIEEANGLYLEFRNKLPLDQEDDKMEEKDNVLYVSPDCKWVITNKWSEHQTILTQMLFHEKEKIKETEDEIRTGYDCILIVKDGDAYKEIDGEQYKKIMKFRYNDDYFDEGYSRIGEINAEGYLLAATKDEYSLLTIRWVEDGTELWRFSLQGVQGEVARIRDNIQEGDIVPVFTCQFEGNEKEGWLTVQVGPSSFFQIAYPSGEVNYLGEYMYSPRFSPDGKYIAYSSIDYDNGVGMEPDEYAQTPPGGIYVREVETGKTAYIRWEDYSPPEEYGLRSRGFNWIEKAAFEEYMNDTERRE